MTRDNANMGARAFRHTNKKKGKIGIAISLSRSQVYYTPSTKLHQERIPDKARVASFDARTKVQY
ncbi:hypothetical protein IH980_01520 [Patescibacteria group bacterium]|nr:hypothetical protein [Patescibacteria group bacterium]